MTAAELLAELRRRGARLEAADGQLRYAAPKGALTDALRAAMAAHKAELLEAIRAEQLRTALEACPCGSARVQIVDPTWWRCAACGVQRTGTRLLPPDSPPPAPAPMARRGPAPAPSGRSCPECGRTTRSPYREVT